MFKGRSVFLLLALSVGLSVWLTLAVVQHGGFFGGVSGAPVDSGFAFNGAEANGQKAVAGSNGEIPAEFNKITEVYQIIQNSYVEDVEKDKLIEGAIEGMLNSLDDPYTVYMDAKETKQFESSLQSTYMGIGTEVSMENGRVTVVTPFRGSPAEHAGLKPGDQIIKVNGISLEGMDLYESVLKIRGPKGTKATLEVVREGIPEPLKVVVIRDEIPIETVYNEIINQGDKRIARISITQFSSDTAQRFAEELQELKQQNIDGMIIDVRGNPGGLLNSVVSIGRILVPNEKAILRVEDSNGKQETYSSTMKDKLPFPVVVLVDKGSASASEILAAALQESGYKVIGQPSFGKGTVQNTERLSDESQVKLTIAKWLTPSGKWIHKKGVQPDVVVEQPEYFQVTQIPEDKILKKDMNEVQVRNLQMILNGLGYATERVDGYFDEKTDAAVKAFQNKHGLTPSGEVDRKTAQKLEDEIKRIIKDPNNDKQLQTAIQTVLEKIK